MPSPFPGMDPYLEDPAFWADFHHRFVDCWCEAIADILPGSYEARLDETVNLLQLAPELIKVIFPDVAVSRGRRSSPTGHNGIATATLVPVTIPHAVFQEVRQAHIKILHRPDRSLVAVLELLSPANKTGKGFADYCAKRTAILQQKVHLVELDLLIGGERLPLLRPLPPGDYYGLISRADRRPDCDVYHWTVRQALPTLPVPLRKPDKDVMVNLESVFGVAYERGPYRNSLPYGKKPSAPLAATDLTWAKNRSRVK